MKRIFISTLLMALVSTGQSIKCWVGNGAFDNKTFTKPDNIGGQSFQSCIKGSAKSGGTDLDYRNGVIMKMGDDCVEGTIPQTQTEASLCYCSTDLCNSAPTTAMAFIFIIAMALLAKYIV